MEIEFQNTEKDYIDFNKIIFKRRFQKFQVSNVLFLVCIAIFFSEDLHHHRFKNCLITVIVYAIIISIYFYFYPLWKANRNIGKSIIKNSFIVEKRKITISEEGLRTEGTGYDLMRNWDSIKSVRKIDRFIQITMASNSNIILSDNCFSSKVELSNFVGLVKSKITYISPVKISNLKYSPSTFGQKKPPYLLGLLCVIPLVGAFVGAGLLLYGIFIYKDKWIITIGVAGILFSVFVFKIMSPSTNDPQFNKGMTELDKGQLNGLIKSIEFYKIQNGNYPDSLQQLDLKGEAISISDPLLMFKGDKTAIFNYHKIGKKYTLFSSGIDKTPNTADDIYPTLQIDTSKIGLIINRK